MKKLMLSRILNQEKSLSIELDLIKKSFEINVPDVSSLSYLILKIKGKYPSASEGNAMADYLSAIHVFIREYFDPEAIIFDVQEFEYSFGDRLSKVFEPRILSDCEEEGCLVDIYVLTSEKNSKGIKSLFDFIPSLKKSITIADSLSKIETVLKERAESFYKD